MFGPNRFFSVSQMRLVDSQTAALNLGIAFEKSQPGRVAISLNSFIGQYGATGRPTKETSIPVLALALTGCVNLDKVLELWQVSAQNVMIIHFPGKWQGGKDRDHCR